MIDQLNSWLVCFRDLIIFVIFFLYILTCLRILYICLYHIFKCCLGQWDLYAGFCQIKNWIKIELNSKTHRWHLAIPAHPTMKLNELEFYLINISITSLNSTDLSLKANNQKQRRQKVFQFVSVWQSPSHLIMREIIKPKLKKIRSNQLMHVYRRFTVGWA